MRRLSLGKARTALGFGASFFSAKVSIYLIPLLIAKFAAPATYGALEFAQSVALFLATVLSGPFLSGLNHLHLTRQRDRMGPEVLAVLWTAAALSGAVIALILLIGLPYRWLIAAAFLSLATSQIGLTTMARAYGQRHATAWTDGLATLLLGAAAAIGMLIGGPQVDLWIGLLLYLASLLVALWLWFNHVRRPWSEVRARLRSAFAIGLPITLLSMFAVWLATSGRILVGLVSPDSVAVYSVAFRLIGFALGVHQLASVAFFRQIYVARTKEADRLFTIIMAAVGSVTFCLMLAAPVIVHYVRFNALEGHSRAQFLSILASMGVFFYTNSAYNWLQLRLNRLQMSHMALWPITAIALIGIAMVLAAPRYFAAHVGLFCWIMAAQSALYFVVAWVMLARRRLPHRRIGIAFLVGTIGLAATGIALQLFA